MPCPSFYANEIYSLMILRQSLTKLPFCLSGREEKNCIFHWNWLFGVTKGWKSFWGVILSSPSDRNWKQSARSRSRLEVLPLEKSIAIVFPICCPWMGLSSSISENIMHVPPSWILQFIIIVLSKHWNLDRCMESRVKAQTIYIIPHQRILLLPSDISF